MADSNWLGLEDDDDRRAAKGPAFISPAKCGGYELRTLDQMNCAAANPEFAGNVHSWKDEGGHTHYDHSRIIFTITDEETGEEKWDVGTSLQPTLISEPGEKRRYANQPMSEGERWRRIMGWPVGSEPTPDQARQWMQNAQARLVAKWLPRLRWARDMDEKAARGEAERG